jgi:predicted PurR-regulated permease PerM
MFDVGRSMLGVSPNMKEYPTLWQRKTMWAALTACFVVLLVVIVGAVIWAAANIVSFLQPILIPVAIAVILTYLLDPLVTKMSRGTLSRTKAVALVFAIAFFALGGLAAWLIPTISIQSANFARQVPAYTERARDYTVDLIYRFDQTFGLLGGAHRKSASTSLTNWLIGPAASPTRAQPTATPTGSPQATASATEIIAPSPPKLTTAERQRIQAYVEKQMPKLEQALPMVVEKLWDILKKSVGGFLGVTGFLLSLILVPIYLFFLLNEKPRIQQRWQDYLPLRESPLRDEVADVLSEINRYVTAYFRGQLLVCLVDGILIGTVLTIFPGLNFAPVIGVLVVILTMVPYIGIIICWVPAVLIAAFQWGDWTHPMIVTGIFILVQNLEGIFYAPRIVGNYVGLHPMTVIVSIFLWGLIIGGVIGPLLAVPLTATIKVLLARYVWGRRLRQQVLQSTEPTVAIQEPEVAAHP